MIATLTYKCSVCNEKVTQTIDEINAEMQISIVQETRICECCEENLFDEQMALDHEVEVRRQEQWYGEYSRERDFHYAY